MKVNDILALTLDTEEFVEIYDTTEDCFMRTLCKGYTSEIDLDTDLRGYVGDEDVICIQAEGDSILIGIGNAQG